MASMSSTGGTPSTSGENTSTTPASSFQFVATPNSGTPAGAPSGGSNLSGNANSGGENPADGSPFGGASSKGKTPVVGGSLFRGLNTAGSSSGIPGASSSAGTTAGAPGPTTPATTGAFTSGPSIFGLNTASAGTVLKSTPATSGGFFAGTSAGGPSSGRLFGGNQTTTPAKLPVSLPSTTPAGAPPADKPTSTGLFGQVPSSGGSGGPKPFGGNSPAMNTTPALGGGIFGAKPSTSTAAAASGASASLIPTSTGRFGGATGVSSASGASSTPTSSGGSLFSNGKAKSNGAFGAQSMPFPAGSSNIFGQKSTDSAGTSAGPASSVLFKTTSAFAAPSTTISNPASSSTAAPASTTSIFGEKPASTAVPATASTTAASNTSAAPASSVFFPSKTLDPPAALATTKAPTGGSIFEFKTATATTTSATATTATGAATTTTTAPTAGTAIFGASKSPITTASTSTTRALSDAAKMPSAVATSLGASSTAGPTSQLPRLKNKTMDEIITRWASDLSKYQKEFKEQATKVATWDRLLVENGEKIQKLYLQTFEAERASNEIERQLVAVESQQDELSQWLDKYENEVNDMFARQIGTAGGEGSHAQLAGPDQERERTYKMAEKLTERLDDMGKDLSKMIKEINDVSGTLSKGNNPDDPLSQIVRVLNSHLSQLQWIDTNATALQARVQAAQKATTSMGGQFGASGGDAAESFYKSYMSRK